MGVKRNNMFKWLRLIKFIKKHRSKGISSFSLITTSDKIILTANDREGNTIEQLRINYK